MADGGCEVWFYHLERTSLDRVLPELLEKTVARGWRAVVRTTAAERIEHLDGWLWTWKDDSFLAHGATGGPDEARQPILLTTDDRNPNGAQALFLLDGALPGALAGFERCIVLFDGRDDAALAEARKLWASLKDLGDRRSYWQQGERGWEKKA